jgi:GDP-L-fucose synthase
VYEDRVELWGTGKPMREFLWSEDMADACIYVMQNVDFKDLIKDKKEIRNTHINIGTGSDITIKELSILISKIIGYQGAISFDSSKPDGTMKKLTDPSKLNRLGWKHQEGIEEGIEKLYSWYINN